MWTWVLAAALAGPGLPPGPTPAIPATTHPRAPFTLGTIDARHFGEAGRETAIRATLLAWLRDRGWPVRGEERGGPDRTVEARFVLLGELLPTVAGRATMRWQLVDRRDGAALLEATSAEAPVGVLDRRLEAELAGLAADPGLTRALVAAHRRDRPAPVEVRPCLTPGTWGRGRVGRGSGAGAAVVVSPDGFAWVAAHAVPVPPAPIEVRTATGRWEARWLRASADLDVALVALPTGSDTPCASMADHIPRARERALAWDPQQGRRPTRILGFRLHEEPGTLVVEAPLAPGAFVFDATGAVLGMRAPGTDEPRIRPHNALTAGLVMRWGPVSVVPEAVGSELLTPDPIFLPPVDRDGDDTLK